MSRKEYLENVKEIGLLLEQDKRYHFPNYSVDVEKKLISIYHKCYRRKWHEQNWFSFMPIIIAAVVSVFIDRAQHVWLIYTIGAIGLVSFLLLLFRISEMKKYETEQDVTWREHRLLFDETSRSMHIELDYLGGKVFGKHLILGK